MEEEIHRKGNHIKLIISLFLVLITLALFWQVQDHAFLNLDDDLYITENRKVQAGLTWDGFLWAFRSTDAVYWHPVTWLSHMLDCQLYGLNPKGHHFNSLLLHAANTLLLFLVLHRMTGALWRSAAVAAIFGVHPLNIESVAWAADRKNVLSFFFGLLTILSYVYYTERGGSRRYVLVFICLAVGLMAKPMLVTLPFVLLLLDYWPLGRLQMGQFALSQEWAKGKGGDQRPRRTAPYLIFEKVPLFVLSAVSVVVSSITAKGQGILLSTKVVPMGLRIENAVVSYLVYVKKMIWPLDLAVFYPYPETVPFWQFGAAGLLLIAMTAWVVKKAGRAPYLFVGWLWYLGTLVPVMGLVQQGLWPALADRFAYIPLIGLFLILSWGSESLVSKWGLKRILLPITAGVILTALVSLTWWQLQYWKSSLRLFERALRVTRNNFLAHMNLGHALANQGRAEEAVVHFSKALETGHIRPQEAYFNLGLAFSSLGKVDEAIAQYERALEIDPRYIDPHINLGTLFLRMNEWDRSLEHFHAALRLDANSTRAYNNIGVIMLHQGKTEEAIVQFRAALKIDPEYAMAKKNLQIAMSRQGSQIPEQNQ